MDIPYRYTYDGHTLQVHIWTYLTGIHMMAYLTGTHMDTPYRYTYGHTLQVHIWTYLTGTHMDGHTLQVHIWTHLTGPHMDILFCTLVSTENEMKTISL